MASIRDPDNDAMTYIEGKVAELISWLLDKAIQAADSDSPVAAGMLTLAAQIASEHADLLERLAQNHVFGATEMVEPTNDELLRIYGLAKRNFNYKGPLDDWPKQEERAATVAGLRAVLARWGSPAPQPPADGEVADLVEWLEEKGHLAMYVQEGERYFRAAELLEHQALLQPIPVAERLPEAEELVAVGWCRTDEFRTAMKCGGSFNGWRERGAGANRCDMRLYAHALPLPSGEVEA